MNAKKYVLRASNKATAIQWTGGNCKEVATFMEKDILDLTFSMNSNLLKVGIMRVPVNDYIVHDPSNGSFTHMSNDEFNKKYKIVKI